MRIFYFLFLILFYSCTSHTYYIVRHAEKALPNAAMSSDVPLSATGEERAIALNEKLRGKYMTAIFSTNTIRTRSTARPLSERLKLPILTYDAKEAGFIGEIKALPRGHYLIVGHSNTVDDLVNGLMGKQLLSDLEDNAYGDLFILRKRGKQLQFEKDRFGK